MEEALESPRRLNYRRAADIIHSLSFPSKMPCPAWGISPEHCQTGTQLRTVHGSVCSTCYACRGHYTLNNVVKAHEARLAGIGNPHWVDAMVVVIDAEADDYFRWFDSGDLQGREHLRKIIEIAERLPDINFWLPTQERQLVRDVTTPANLTIRVSLPLINDTPRNWPGLTSSLLVAPKKTWADKVAQNTPQCHYCPAPLQGNKCRTCRACWDPQVKHVVYRKH